VSGRPVPALLLPGIDGSGRLFAPLVAAGPRHFEPRVLSYPADPDLGYDALPALVRAHAPAGEPWILVAESYSGPVAIRVAAERPPGLVAVVLAATFLVRPLHPLLHPIRGLVGARFFGLPMPAPAVRHFLAGPGAPDALVAEVQAAVTEAGPAVMARRSAEALRVDVRSDLVRVTVPVLYLAPTRDRLVRRDVAPEVLAARPDAEIVRLVAPHMILQRQPHASLRAIEAFLERVEGRAETRHAEAAAATAIGGGVTGVPPR
jgi:pimeloyl-[acyl-carrier protein] methyl ester esterase